MSDRKPWPSRKSIRLKGYDYSQPNAYFVTACAHGKRLLFGRVHDFQMHLSGYGQIVQACWNAVPQHFPAVELDAFQVMPNHFHGILFIVAEPAETITPHARTTLHLSAPVYAEPRGPIRGSVGAIVGALKSAATKQINLLRHGRRPAIWQRNYHEHIVRSEQELYRIRDYIINNPATWTLDRENPNRTGTCEIEEEIFGPQPSGAEDGREFHGPGRPPDARPRR